MKLKLKKTIVFDIFRIQFPFVEIFSEGYRLLVYGTNKMKCLNPGKVSDFASRNIIKFFSLIASRINPPLLYGK